MFWGLIMEPNKRYTQVVEKPFHISQAALDISTGDNESCQVMVVVDGKNFLICTLQKTKHIQVPLDLYFKTGDSISFLTNGKCNVHLTGYLDPEFEEDLEEEEEEDEEEAPKLVPAKNKRKLDNSSDKVAAKKQKPDKKAAAKATEDSDESDDDEDQLQKLLDGEDVDTDENDESFKMNSLAEDDSDEDDSGEEEEDSDEGEDDDDEEQAENGVDSSEAETTLDTSKEEPDMSKMSKSQKKRLKKKLAQEKAKQGQPQVNGVDKAKKQDSNQQKAEKKKEQKKESEAGGDKKEKKSLSGGVMIEDLKVGTGPVAKPGKVVQVYYEGRLKSNNKMFDNCLKGPGFKFRLGSKEVISGWDIGVSGMKTGGKRKIVCPPAMAYGAKGSPPVIPPNSTLVFEVELKNVK